MNIPCNYSNGMSIDFKAVIQYSMYTTYTILHTFIWYINNY